MFRQRVRSRRVLAVRRFAPAVLSLLGLVALAPKSNAQATLGPISIGGGVRTSYTFTHPDVGDSTNTFSLNSARLYISGPVTNSIKFMVNTEYDGVTNKVGILDAVAQFDFSPKFHIWAGRFLPPSDRANLYGPYYSNQWGVYTDGIQDGYPFVFQGRDNGVAWWGDFGSKVKTKISAGVFDGKSATGKNDVLGTARVQFDFWDKEEGYYLNGTYYGDKNLLSIAGAGQLQDGHTASTIDFLLERKLAGAGTITIESEYSNYNRLGGYDGNYAKSQGAYGLASYLFPKPIGVGKIQLLGKYAAADFSKGVLPSYNQHTTEINVNYIIKQFNARVMTFYNNTHYSRFKPDFWQLGIGLQIQI